MDLPNPSAAGLTQAAAPVLVDRKGRRYEPAIGPRLKAVLQVLFISFALLGASGAYQSSITFLNWLRSPVTYTNPFTLWVILFHIALGVAVVVPFLAFGSYHYLTARRRTNRMAIKLGVALFLVGIVVCLTGLALIQFDGMPKLPSGLIRGGVYVLHVVTPILCVGLYVWHRRRGPKIRWSYGYVWTGLVVAFIGIMTGMHFAKPRAWFAVGSREGEKYFLPSRSKTSDGKFIDENVLMADAYCLKCHEDAYNGWFHSAHHFSSFNNPAYLFAVKETREVALKHDGDVRRSRWCAGCHDPVPFFSGKFDDPNYDIVNDPTAHAGITCTTCHAITNVNSTVGNGDFTIEEPLHYPFAFSENSVLQWINNQLVKAKPDFHKQTFLKPFHKTTDFCSTCHKVSLPMDVTHYKEWLRGQNHHDPFLLSGVSGGNARAFYYPEVAKERCADCHMPRQESNDFGAYDFDGKGKRTIANHLFPGANTGLPHLLTLEPRYKEHSAGLLKAAEAQAEFLKDKKLRIDLFGLREGGTLDGKLLGPIRPELPKLRPGQTYLLDVVVRTLGLGHVFPQGTADSNEIWIDVEARSGGKVIGRSGGLYGPNETGKVDEWSHFVNILMLDRHGNRINRRNPQDIFTPLYDHQIPPGAAHVIHYEFPVPADLKAPVELRVRLRYRKFDHEYMEIVYGGDKDSKVPVKSPKLPIIDLCEDRVTLPVEGVAAEVPAQTSPIQPAWQRWNDYGIGYFLTSSADPEKRGARQAVEAFERLAAAYSDDKTAQAHAQLNLARTFFSVGELERAGRALTKIKTDELPAPWWTVAWFNALVNAQNGHLDEAIRLLSDILDPEKQDKARKFDFSRDYEVRVELGRLYYKRWQPGDPEDDLRQAVAQMEKVLELDSENLDAHYWLSQAYGRLGEGAAVGAPPSVEGAANLAEVTRLAERFLNEKATSSQRVEAARELAGALEAFARKPAQLDEPKLPFAWDTIKQVRPIYRDHPDAGVRTAAALVLGKLHLVTHAVYKPDDNAKEIAVKTYRAKHPAANNAAKALKVYPLRREGAPGL